MNILAQIAGAAGATLLDIAPIAIVLVAFQLATRRRVPARVGTLLIGLAHLIAGLTLFRVGLETSIIPIGRSIAEHLAGPVLQRTEGVFRGVLPLCAFAALLGFTATLIEPNLIAIADRVRDLSAGTLNPWHFRLLIAFGVAMGLLMATVRVLVGIPMDLLFLALILLIAPLALSASRQIVPLALDSGAVATSVVMVPLIAAFGIAIADTMPGRDPIRDGFGMIVVALLMPAATLLIHAHIQELRRQRDERIERR